MKPCNGLPHRTAQGLGFFHASTYLYGEILPCHGDCACVPAAVPVPRMPTGLPSRLTANDRQEMIGSWQPLPACEMSKGGDC